MTAEDIDLLAAAEEKTRSRFTDDDRREMSQAVAEALSAGLDPHAAAVRTVGFASLRPTETSEIAAILQRHRHAEAS